MTHPDDIRAYLKGKLEDRNPKCANCAKASVDPDAVTFDTMAPLTSWLHCVMTNQTVQDLSVCSAWEKRDA